MSKKRDEAEVAFDKWALSAPGSYLWVTERGGFLAGFRAARGEGTRTAKAWANVDRGGRFDAAYPTKYAADMNGDAEQVVVRATVTYKAPKAKRSKKP